MTRRCYGCNESTYQGHGVCLNAACPRNASIPQPPEPPTRPDCIDLYTWERIAPMIALWTSPFHLSPHTLARLLDQARQAESHTYCGTIHVFGKNHLPDAISRIGSSVPIFDLTEWDIPRHPETRHLTGVDPICRAAIVNCPSAEAILTELIDLVDYPVPPPAIGIMCQHGRHRAPSFAIFLCDLAMHQAVPTFYNPTVRRRLRAFS